MSATTPDQLIASIVAHGQMYNGVSKSGSGKTEQCLHTQLDKEISGQSNSSLLSHN